MGHSVVGWESVEPVPNTKLNDYLSVRDGRLHFDELDLHGLFSRDQEDRGIDHALQSPLELVYLPRIRQQIDTMNQVFARAIQDAGYLGRFVYVYASKANSAEEVVRSTLRAGAHHEISSAMDIEIIQFLRSRDQYPSDRMIICNGFKPQGSDYAESILQLRRDHEFVIPVLEDLSELPALVDSGLEFDIGLRQKCYGPHQNLEQMEAANSRFGMTVEDIFKAAEMIEQAPNLHLKLYHAMVGSQINDHADFVNRLRPPIEVFAELRKKYADLSLFDFGGGVPVAMTLDFKFDYEAFARLLLEALQESCERQNVAVPDVVGELGRYTVAEHGAHFFKIINVKHNKSPYPWYIIDGSIMTSFPDSWALGEHFIVLPLNHLAKPFQRVQLGGITCDSDDIYPPHRSSSPLYLPVDADELYIGFFGIGAYQEMLGGVGGSKHCVIPEADELIVDQDEEGRYTFELLRGQGAAKVLDNLGYRDKRTHR